MNYSTVICDEVTESFDKKIITIPSNLNEKKVTCKPQSFYILLAFLLITIVLLIAVSINCYMMKYQVKNVLQFTTQLIK